VLYDRYILGRWCAAEGAVYPDFAADANSFLIYNSDPRLKKLDKITVGVDFGGTKSGTSFVAVASVDNYQYAVVLASERHTAAFDAAGLAQRFCNFCEKIASDWGFPHAVYCDSAESVLIRSRKRCRSQHRRWRRWRWLRLRNKKVLQRWSRRLGHCNNQMGITT